MRRAQRAPLRAWVRLAQRRPAWRARPVGAQREEELVGAAAGGEGQGEGEEESGVSLPDVIPPHGHTTDAEGSYQPLRPNQPRGER